MPRVYLNIPISRIPTNRGWVCKVTHAMEGGIALNSNKKKSMPTNFLSTYSVLEPFIR